MIHSWVPWTIVAIGAAIAFVITAISRHIIERAAVHQTFTPEMDRGFNAGLERAIEIVRGCRVEYHADTNLRDSIINAINGARRGS